jgi:hypothetical protein
MNDADLVHLVDKMEDQVDGYLTLEEVEVAAGSPVSSAIEEALLLVDYRTRLDGSTVTLCRLNRHHPLVKELTHW